MSLELAILKGLLNKERYKEYRPFVDPKNLFPAKEHNKLLEIIDEEHSKATDNDIDTSTITIRGKLLANGSAILPELITDFEKLDVSTVVFDEVFETIKKRNLASQIALKAIDVAEGNGDFNELLTYVEENKTTKLASTDDVNILSTDITTYAEEVDGDDTIHWCLHWLNKSLGPMRKGNLGHIFAVPETGKTALWISQVVHTIQNTNKPVLIFFNEEAGHEVMYRMYSAMFGIAYKTIVANKATYAQKFKDAGGDRIIFVDEAPLRIEMMERMMSKYEPCLCIIDNADKIRVRQQDRRDLEIHEIYKWARELAKKHCPVITVAHADATAYGAKYLDESMMANSKVGKPAEMDFIIGIGREDGENVARYLSISKNKLRGDKDTVESLRHGRWAVALQSDISRFIDTVSENT
jgi:replicative DNA helicase